MMRSLVVLIFVHILHVLSAQKEDYVWFLGIDQSPDPGIQAMMVDWNNTVIPIKKELGNGIDNNNASICDEDGNLLFWSNGCSVINRNQEVMPNGDTLNWDPFREVVGWADCTIGYPSAQNVKILPDPSDREGFYIIHKAIRYRGQFEDITQDLRFSYVDMSLDNGLGDVIVVDSIIYDDRLVPHCLEAIHTDNGVNWWILQPVENDSLILTYQINEDGIERFPDQNSRVNFEDKRAGAGTARISPDGTRYAYYDYFLNLHVYDFDRSTGQLSNHEKVTIFEDAEEKPNNEFRFGSVEWSPNSRFMYVAVSDSLFQVDSWEADMDEGIQLIDVYNGTLDPFATTFYIATQAPDCKIYICSTNGTRSYHVINKPDELGIACDFVQNGLKLPQSAGSANLPLFPRFRVDEEDKCDPSIVSVFGNEVYYRRDLNVYPNPTIGAVTVDIPDGFREGQLEIYNLQGQLVNQRLIDRETTQLSLDMSYLPQGHYHVELYPRDNPDRVYYGTQVVKVE